MQVAGFGPDRSIAFSFVFLVRISQKARVARAARMRIGRAARWSMHPQSSQAKASAFVDFHGSGSGSGAAPNQKLPRDG